MTASKLFAYVRQIIAVLSIVFGSINLDQLPNSIRVSLVSIGGVILTADHVMGALMDPTTSINMTKTTTTTPAASSGPVAN